MDVIVEAGARLHVDLTGVPDGPLVLFLHGALASGRAFRGQVPALSDRYHVALPDQRGHGRSGHFHGDPPWPTLDVDIMTRDVLALLDALSPEAPAHVVGVSMGGILAARAAAARPERFASLSLWSAPPRPDPKWAAYFARPFSEALAPQTVRLAELWHGDPYWRTLARALFTLFATPPAGAFAGRPRPARALVMQADDDDLLDIAEPEAWRARIDAPTQIVRLPTGGHTFFADGRDGTRAANATLRRFLDG